MATHEHYYVPAQSKWPIIATVGMFVTVYGLATWFNDLKAARPDSHGPLIFFVGGLLVAYMLFGWFGAVIKESRAGLYSAQLDRSFRASQKELRRELRSQAEKPRSAAGVRRERGRG